MIPQEVIRDIRVERGVDVDFIRKLAADHDFNRAWQAREKTLRNAVRELSEGLYTKDAHFILELIQNADDNKYIAGVQPTLTFNVSPGEILISCNEKGFSEKDVRAICDIGASTKSGNKAEGYIGEKGIGFKAVFKVAEKVYIKSAGYEFMFDRSSKDGALGMLAPIWMQFPRAVQDGNTHILLALSPSCNYSALAQDFKTFDLTVLLFLRQLARITINVKDLPTRSLYCGARNASLVELRSSEVVITDTKKYYVAKHTVRNLPTEPKRKGVTSSDVILAFPLRDNEPLISAQSVFAFLPLKDFGFKFLIQADFLVPASREDVLDCAWNRTLKNGIVKAFATAAKEMVTMPGISRSWLSFVPRFQVAFSFLSSLSGPRGEIVSAIKTEDIAFSTEDRLTWPSALVEVPSRFLDRSGVPLISPQGTPQLSLKYKSDEQSVLTVLGVRQLTINEFLHCLCQTKTSVFGYRNQEWHEDLSKVLLDLYHSNKHKIRWIEIIPLRNNRWVSAASLDTTPVYFNKGSDDTEIPAGVAIQVVQSQYSQGNIRSQFLERLGVKHCDAAEICKLLCHNHRNGESGLAHLTMDEIIHHAKYLFQHWYLVESDDFDLPSTFWLANNDGNLMHGNDMHIDPPRSSFSMKGLHSAPGVHFLHPEYLSAPSNAQSAAWIRWLTKKFGLSKIPRLIDKADPNHLSAAFSYVIAHYPSKEVLRLLLDNWSTYGEDIPYVADRIANLTVDTTCGPRLLRDTFLPDTSLKKVAKDLGDLELAFVLLNDSLTNSSELARFGVVVTADIHFFLNTLLVLKKRGDACKKPVYKVYRRLQSSMDEDDRNHICESFEANRLVFVDDGNGSSQWFPPSQCVWRSPSPLNGKVTLSNVYPDCEELFVIVLGVPNATCSDLIDEMFYLSRNPTDETSVLAVKSIFKYLPHWLRHSFLRDDYEDKILLQNKAQLRRLADAVDGCFPVRVPESEDIELQKLSDPWFIADRMDLYDAFSKEVPVFDFSVEEIQTLRPLIRILQLDHKRLSSAVVEKAEPVGEHLQDLELTDRLRDKSEYFFRVIQTRKAPAERRDKQLTSKHKQLLEQMRVYRVSAIRLIQTVHWNDREITIERTAPYHLSVADNFDLYLPMDDKRLTEVWSIHLPQLLMSLFSIYPKNVTNQVQLLFTQILSIEDSAVLKQLLDLEEIESLGAAEHGDLFSYEGDDDRVRRSHLKPAAGTISGNQNQQHTGLSAPRVLSSHASSSTSGAAGTRSKKRSHKAVSSGSVSLQQTYPDVVSKLRKLADFAGSVVSLRGKVQIATNSSLTNDSFDLNSLRATLPSVNTQILHVKGDIMPNEDRHVVGNAPATSLASFVPAAPPTTAFGSAISTVGFDIVDVDYDFSPVQQAQNDATGFLGEFYIAKLLENTVTGFSLSNNWTSSLRYQARLCEDYEFLTAYEEPEISDIRFHDTDGSLRQWLISSGCEQAAHWNTGEAAPEYFIEVKSTSGKCNEPFHMSSNQIRLAKAMAIKADVAPTAVYIVFRAYNLGTSNPDFVVYIDPWTMVMKGDLEVKVDNWELTPRQS